MQPQNAIRSIRVASALIDRFRALVADRSSSMEQLELAIGESQQIYPEIWRHLDDARSELAAHDRDVAAFDELRRREFVHLGVTNVDVTSEISAASLLVGRISYTVTKTAVFNIGGVQRARAAAEVLMAALPEVDWVAVARAEDQEISAAGSLHGSKWRNIALSVVGAAAVLVIAIVIAGWLNGAAEKENALTPADFLRPVQRALVGLRAERLIWLNEHYSKTCDRSLVPELALLLRANSQPNAAHKVETEPCTPR